MQLTSASKWYLGSALAALLVLMAGWFLLVSPQKATAAELAVSADSKASANHGLEQQIASLKLQYKDLPVLQQQAAAIRAKLPQTDQLPALLRTLSDNAERAGVSLDSVSPQTPSALGVNAGSAAQTGGNILATPGQVSQIPLGITVTGNFANVRLFINSLETMQRALLVTGLDINRVESSDGSSGSGLLKVGLTAAVFMANPGTAPAAAAATNPTAASGDAEPAS